MAKDQNLVKLIGDVIAVAGERIGKIVVGDDECVLETVAQLNSGTFTQQHLIVLNGAKVDKGKRYAMIGKLAIFDKLTKVSADPAAWKIVPKKTASKNVCLLSGRLAGEFNYFPPDPINKRKAMAGFLLAVKDARSEVESLFKGVLFQAMATAWDRVASPNSPVTLNGRIRYREYDVEKPDMLEIIGMKAGSSIQKAEVENEFADYTPSEGF